MTQRVPVTISLPPHLAAELKAQAERDYKGNVSRLIRAILNGTEPVTKSAPLSPHQAT